ncbi:TetR family transcriptional regulator [Pseudorhodoferax sp. Leaf265]|uniref:TetR family transcriptional regulator n=1 Tax=Pseudorhodoferax sp. Leaf265 TaxID=1736315 RepID=UPI0006F68C62|nr:TetR family transcriptional regulator [Pseudorhodoferax sp. Leaf265]KQP05207.1 TetR family transcriptional regulator [Pseudorhodoferax sp. Leaf265]
MARPAKTVDGQRKPGVREQAVITSRANLLRAATRVFAKHGFAGGRVGQISKAAKSYDRMIYYYFGSKEGLYIAVIEDIYRRMNEAEEALALDEHRPVESLETVVRFVCGYYRKHPEFVTLLNNENLLQGRHIAKMQSARQYSSPAISVLQLLLAAGSAQGVFRDDVAVHDVYMMIAALGYFPQSNRFTLSEFLGQPIDDPAASARWEAFVVDAVLRTVMREPAPNNESPSPHGETPSWQKPPPPPPPAKSSSATSD